MPKRFRHTVTGPYIQARLHRQHHARLQTAVCAFAALGRNAAAVIAHIMDIHAQPVASAMHIKLAKSFFLDHIIHIAHLASVE